jgi:hypothetical protein
MYRILGKMWDDVDIPVTRQQFKDGITLFCFTVDPTSAPDLSYLGRKTTGSVGINVDFKTDRPTTVPITVILYATFPGTIGIDESRVVRDLSYLRYQANGGEILNEMHKKTDRIDVEGTAAIAS